MSRPSAVARLTAWLVVAATAPSQCNFSPLEPGPSALETKPPRTAFLVFGRDGARAFIDKAGKPTTPPATDKGMTPYREFVDGHPRYGFHGATGAVTIPPRFLDAQGFHERLAAVEDANGEWGFINESGQMEVPARFHAASEFNEGVAPVDLCNRCGYVDRAGKQIFEATFRHCYRFSEGVAKVEASQGVWGFIDKSGKLLAQLSGDGEGQLFADGLMPSEKGGAVGFVDKSGAFVIAPRFAFVHSFSNGLAAVKEDDKWGYVDKTGAYAIPPRFGDPEDPRGGAFSEGLAFVTDLKTGLHGFVDRAGKYVISPRYRRCNDPSGAHCAFDGGLAWVETAALEGYINRLGDFVWSAPVGRGRPQR